MTTVEELAVTMLVNGAFLGIEKATGKKIDGNIAGLIINALKQAMEERNIDYDTVILALIDEQADKKYGKRELTGDGTETAGDDGTDVKPITNPDAPQARR